MKWSSERGIIFLAGAMLGGAVAMLATPYSGRRARRIVRHKFSDGAQKLSEVAGAVQSQSRRVAGRVMERVPSLGRQS